MGPQTGIWLLPWPVGGKTSPGMILSIPISEKRPGPILGSQAVDWLSSGARAQYLAARRHGSRLPPENRC